MTTQPQSCFFTIPFIPPVLWVLFLCSLLLGSVVSPAAAQSQSSVATAELPELAEMLASPIDAERSQALRQVVTVAKFSPEVDLTSTVPALTTIYNDDPNEKNRLVAVAALSTIGSKAGLKQVRRRFLRDPSLRVQYVSLYALIDHYGRDVFAGNRKELALAKNVLARLQEAGRLSQMRRATPSVAEQR